MPGPLPILLAPLNWGLGHATRSLPLATALEAAAAQTDTALDIHWASDGDALALLRRERPGDTHHALPGYGVRYPTRSAWLNMALSGPGILRAIVRESTAVRALHAEYDYGLIVSDNRYGCRVPGVRSLLVTHQLHLPIGGLPGMLSQKLQDVWLRGFDEVLVPDYPTRPRLAGAMSGPLPRLPCRYLGPVSRFAARGGSSSPPGSFVHPMDHLDRADHAGTDYDLVCLLSGPEPTRTQLELAVYEALYGVSDALLVRGTTAARPTTPPPAGLAVRDLVTSAELQAVLAQAQTIITRPGYTTVMDLAALGRKAVFVPTPAQPEQALLGESLVAGGFGVTVEQASVGAPGVLAEALAQLRVLQASGTPATLSRKPTDDALATWAQREVSGLRQRSVNTL